MARAGKIPADIVLCCKLSLAAAGATCQTAAMRRP
jgi:hypothetical protein